MSVSSTLRRLRALLVPLVCLLGAEASRADNAAVMLWFVDDPTITIADGGTMGITEMPGWSSDPNVNTLAVRMLADDGGDGAPVFLDLMDYDAASGRYRSLGYPEAWVNAQGRSGVNYSGLPTTLDIDNAIFRVQLGILDWDEEAQALVWQSVLAESQSTTYKQLFNSGHINPGELAIPDHTPWSNLEFYMVPEPSSGLLLLVGAALLALLRRRAV